MLLIDETITQKFFELFLDLSEQTAIMAHDYLGTHDNLSGYYLYPELVETFPRDHPDCTHLFQEIPFLIYEIPKYRITQFPKDKTQYDAIFNNFSKECLDCTSLDEFHILLKYIESELDLKNLITSKDDLSEKVKRINNDIVTRYLFMTSATSSIPVDLNTQLKKFAKEKLSRFLSSNLPIDILVPICLATFEDDTITLSNNVEIIRISEEIQKSRQYTCSYEAVREDWVAACATHMIVIHNYEFENKTDLTISSVTQNYNAYPLQEINNIFSAIRICTGYTIGYAQLLSSPLQWIDGFCADLLPLYGAKSHFINPKESEKLWLTLSINKITSKQAEKIKNVYSSILACQQKNKNNVQFALNRFNRCVLRNEDDDMATDATIGLESLLSGGTKGEITYTMSNRLPIVFAYEKNHQYSPSTCRAMMKKIYNYRSKVVHGEKIKENDTFVEVNGSNIPVPKLAVDFLRYTLLFMLEHQEFLETKNIDNYIDNL